MTEFTLVETVADNKEGYSKRQLAGAKKAWDLRAKLGFPSTPDYKNIVQGGLIQNCPINVEDIKRADSIYGPDVPSLKGKTTR